MGFVAEPQASPTERKALRSPTTSTLGILLRRRYTPTGAEYSVYLEIYQALNRRSQNHKGVIGGVITCRRLLHFATRGSGRRMDLDEGEGLVQRGETMRIEGVTGWE